MHAADLLGRIRAQIRDLKALEADIRAGFAQRPDGYHAVGDTYSVHISHQRRRILRQEALPEDLLRQPDLWEHRESVVVSCRALGDDQGAWRYPTRPMPPMPAAGRGDMARVASG